MKGIGLFSSRLITTGEFILEHVGEVKTREDFFSERASKTSLTHTYAMVLGDLIIDATKCGNLSPLVNHSCDSYLEAQKWTDEGVTRIDMVASKEIGVGEELCFNNKFDNRSADRKGKRKYRCGATKCLGYI